MSTQSRPHIVKMLRALGDETRVQILKILLEHDLCVGALARVLNVSKPAVSQHLKVLREAGLVRGEKRGYWTHYEVKRELLQEISQFLQSLANYHKGEDYRCPRTEEIEPGEGRRVLPMCKNCCEQPDKLKSTPEKCTPEQIEECHGHKKEHPCECDKED